MEIKVIIDNSVLIAASLNIFYESLHLSIVDYHHKISLPLFDYFNKHVEKEYGVTTRDIESNSETRLLKVINRRISELKIPKGDELKTYSAIRIEVKRNFDKICKLLTVHPVDDNKSKEILQKIVLIYEDIKNTIKQEVIKTASPQIISGNSKFYRGMKNALRDQTHHEIRRYRKLEEKFVNRPPDIGDCELLKQAYYLKKFRFKKNKVYIVSTDFHFSKHRDHEPHETLVPDKIEEGIGIRCEWPDDMLKKLQENQGK